MELAPELVVAAGAGTGTEVGVGVGEGGGDDGVGTWCLQAGIEAGAEGGRWREYYCGGEWFKAWL